MRSKKSPVQNYKVHKVIKMMYTSCGLSYVLTFKVLKTLHFSPQVFTTKWRALPSESLPVVNLAHAPPGLRQRVIPR